PERVHSWVMTFRGTRPKSTKVVLATGTYQQSSSVAVVRRGARGVRFHTSRSSWRRSTPGRKGRVGAALSSATESDGAAEVRSRVDASDELHVDADVYRRRRMSRPQCWGWLLLRNHTPGSIRRK